MHGTKLGITKSRTRSLPAPRKPFSQLPLQRLKARRVSLRNGTVHSRRRFTRPQQFPLARIPLRGRSSPPDASLSRVPANFTRSVFWLRYLPPVCPSGWMHRRLKPVALPPIRSSGRAASLRSSSGVFAPSNSKRSTGYPAFRFAFRKRPIFVRSPPPFHLWFSGGSTFPIRYIFGGLLFPKPLGTLLTMPQRNQGVNGFFVISRPFQQLLYFVFRTGYSADEWNRCE